MSKEDNLNKSLYKTEIAFLKLLLPIMGISYAITSLAFYVHPLVQGFVHFFGMFLSPMLFMLVSSYVFKFCIYHRLFIFYIIIDELLRIIDFYNGLYISSKNLALIHLSLAIVFIATALIIFIYKKVKCNLKVCK